MILIVAVRNESKTDAAKADLLKSTPTFKAQGEVWNLDKESIKTVTTSPCQNNHDLDTRVWRGCGEVRRGLGLGGNFANTTGSASSNRLQV